MFSTATSRPVLPGRFSRTALIAFLIAGIGDNIFEYAPDPWLTVPSFLLVVLGVSALTRELTDQAQRAQDRWAASDTGIVVVLLVYAALLSAALAFGSSAPDERTSASCFLTLYVVLAGYFWWVRHKTLRAARA